MREHPGLQAFLTTDCEIEFWDLDNYTKALVQDSLKERRERMSIARRTCSSGYGKKKTND